MNYKMTDVSATPGSNAFLLTGGQKTALFESGLAHCADKLIENIEKLLGTAALDYLFLTHTHYDHLGALPYLRMRWPGLTVLGSAYGQYVLTRDGALRVIRQFSSDAAEARGLALKPYDDALMKIDRALADGEVTDLGGVDVKAVELLGHTKCSMGYFIGGSTLVVTESTGYLAPSGAFDPAYVLSSRDALRSVKICRALAPTEIIVPHFKPVSIEDVPDYWDLSEQAILRSRDFILERLKAGTPDEQLLGEYTDAFWVGDIHIHQPKFAFVANAKVAIDSIRREWLQGE